MMLTKRALKAKTIEELIDAVASMCKRNAIREFHRLEYGGMPHVSSDDDKVSREILPMSDLVASIVNITGRNWIIGELRKYKKSGGSLRELLMNIPDFNIEPVLETINMSGVEFLNEKGGVNFTDKQAKIAKDLVEIARKEYRIEPNDYLTQIKMDIIQEAYVGCLP